MIETHLLNLKNKTLVYFPPFNDNRTKRMIYSFLLGEKHELPSLKENQLVQNYYQIIYKTII